MKKRLLWLLLALCLCVVLLPGTAGAENVVLVSDEAGLRAAVANGGEIQMTGNIVIRDSLTVYYTDVTLDLNGCVLSRANDGNPSRVIQMMGGKLTLKDSNTNAPKHYFRKVNGVWVWDDAATDSTCFVTGGVITGGDCLTQGVGFGGGVAIRDGGIFQMTGGNIVGCQAMEGSAVGILSGTFIMDGGSIVGCKAYYDGGAVWVGSGAAFIMNDGTIGECTYGGVSNSGTFTDNTQCTVTFQNDGTTRTETIRKKTTVAEPEQPTKTGYHFVGWYYDKSGTETRWNFSDPVTENLTLTAKWTPVVYDITVVDANGDEKEINYENKDDVLGDGGSVKYEDLSTASEKKGKLTLTNASLVSEDEYPINASKIDTLEIVLVGQNRLRTADDTCIIAKNLIFSGAGTINVVVDGEFAEGASAIDCYGGITVHSGSITVRAKTYAVSAENTVTVNNGTMVLIATDVDDSGAVALDSTADPIITLGEELSMITSTSPDGAGAVITAAAETERIGAAKYLRILRSHKHCVCGTGTDFDGHTAHDELEWIPWSSTTALPTAAGNYYLEDNVTLTAQQTVASGVKLCLNGHSILGSGTKITGAGELTITDCGTTGSIAGLEAAGGTLTLYGGSIPSGETLKITSGASLCMSGRAKNESMIRIEGGADFTMEGNAQNNGMIRLSETVTDARIRFGGHAGGTGAVEISQPQTGARIQLSGDAAIASLRGETMNTVIAVSMQDNAVIGAVEALDFSLISMRGNTKLGAQDSSFAVDGKWFELQDQAQVFGTVEIRYEDDPMTVTLRDRARINGDVALKRAGGAGTFLMQDESVIDGDLRCADEQISVDLRDNARITGCIDVGSSTVDGKAVCGGVKSGSFNGEVNCSGGIENGTFRGNVTCSGEIENGVFYGEVVNNGTITGGIFYGTVRGSGTIAESAKVSVTFDSQGGSAVETQRVLRGQKAAKPNDPARSGYTFDGWYAGNAAYDFDTPVLDALTLTARWTLIPVEEPRTPWWIVLPALEQEFAFRDVSRGDWFYGDVYYAYETGLMTGTGIDTFSPSGATTRGMIVTILARMEGVDTSGTPWYAAGRRWAMANGVSDGTNMERRITREQLAAMLYRYAKLCGYDVTANDAAISTFADGAQVSAYAREAMAWAVENGLIAGSGGCLAPQSSATRAQTAAMLHRFCERILK